MNENHNCGEKLQGTFRESDPASQGAGAHPSPELLKPLGLQLRDLREAKGWSQDVLAQHLRVDRSLVAHWESGKRKPRSATLQKILFVLKPRSNNGNGNLAVTVTKGELSGILLELEQAGKEQLDRAIALCDYAYLPVLSTLILAGSGGLEIAVDVRAIDLYLKHRKELMEEKRLQSADSQRNVTPKSKDWSQGQGVYGPPPDTSSTAQGDTPICSDEGTQHNTPTVNIDNHDATNGGDLK